MSEFDFIHWVRQQTAGRGDVLVGIGDDAAVLKWPDGAPCLVATDMLLEGSCFLLDGTNARLVGRKALAVNLSDVAAMAGRPRAAVVSVGLPRRQGRMLAEQTFLGLRELAAKYDVALIGGDTNAWDGPLVINVTVLGEPTGRGPVLRKGAEPGDWLFVTGPLGGSILGKHLTFEPRIHLAQRLHQAVHLKAMIDVSDGLAADLGHLCDESGCGAVVEAARVPVSESVLSLKDGKPPLEHALGDGEDFELLFAVGPEDGQRLVQDPSLTGGDRLYHVGNCVAEGLWLQEGESRRPLPRLGYVHAFQ